MKAFAALAIQGIFRGKSPKNQIVVMRPDRFYAIRFFFVLIKKGFHTAIEYGVALCCGL